MKSARYTKFKIADYLDEVGCASLQEIAEYVGLTKRSVSMRITELRRDGYNITYKSRFQNSTKGLYFRGGDQFNNFVDPCKKLTANEFAKKYIHDSFTKSHQLCWGCQNATNNGCSWSHKLIPVEGWDATPTEISYEIRSCPQFIPD